jgi:hypothetical protein
MEFDTNTTPISDEARQLAETKKLTLKPLHSDVTPELPSDSEVATRHIIEPPISNVSNDVEQDTTPIQPSQEVLNRPAPVPRAARSGLVVKIAMGVVTICVVGVALYLLTPKA